jgi:hypothetical protein
MAYDKSEGYCRFFPTTDPQAKILCYGFSTYIFCALLNGLVAEPPVHLALLHECLDLIFFGKLEFSGSIIVAKNLSRRY